MRVVGTTGFNWVSIKEPVLVPDSRQIANTLVNTLLSIPEGECSGLDEPLSKVEHSQGTGLRFLLTSWLLVLALVPMCIFGYLGYQHIKADRLATEDQEIQNSASWKSSQITAWFDECFEDLAAQVAVINRLQLGNQITSSEQSARSRQYLTSLHHQYAKSDYANILVTDLQNSLVHSSVDQNRIVGKHISEIFPHSQLIPAVQKAQKNVGPVFTGFEAPSNHDKESCGYIVQAFSGASGQVAGVLIFKLSVTSLEKILDDHDGYFGFSQQDVAGLPVELDILNKKLLMFVEKPFTAVAAPLRKIRVAIFMLLALFVVVYLVAGFFVSQMIIKSLKKLSNSISLVEAGQEPKDLDFGNLLEFQTLGSQFLQLMKRLAKAKEINDRQYALKRCQYELNEAMRGKADLPTLCESVLTYIREYYQAVAGVFYLCSPGRQLIPGAQFGLTEDQESVAEIRIGQGLVGQAVKNRQARIVKCSTDSLLKVHTSVGYLVPHNIVVFPIHIDGQIKAVLELGVMQDVTEGDLEFLHLCNNSIAATLDSVRAKERVHRLLEETRSQAEELSTQQKTLRDTNIQLLQSNDYKNEFLANMSHELRTPLNSMLIMSRILAENRDTNLSSIEVDSAETIHQAGAGLLTIIDDLLDLSKAEAGRLELNLAPVILRSLIESVESIFSVEAERRGLGFRVLTGMELPETIEADSLRVSQIVENLLRNALKFTEQGEIVFSIRRPDQSEIARSAGGISNRWLVFSVADTGIGVNTKSVANIFDSFSQADGSINRRFGGSGLGLSISHKLAVLMGGHLTIESVEGKGSIFCLFLPAAEVSGTGDECLTNQSKIVNRLPGQNPIVGTGSTIQEAQNKQHWQRQARTWAEAYPGPSTKPENATKNDTSSNSYLAQKEVLLVDDDMRTAFSLSQEFENLGTLVSIARTWQECLDLVQDSSDLFLVLVNAMLLEVPESNLLSELRNRSGNNELVVITLHGADEKVAAEQADLSVVKPVNFSELVQKTALLAGIKSVGQVC